jgi:phosphocarrier protein FPr
VVGIVIVSHSRPLARAAVALAAEMLPGRPVRIAVAAGLDEHTFGTDAVQIAAAVAEADDGDGVVVLMDLGSAVLSAELALDLIDEPARARAVLCPAPLVEGLVVAAVAAAGGAGRAEVAAEAAAALAGKQSHLDPQPRTASSATPAATPIASGGTVPGTDAASGAGTNSGAVPDTGAAASGGPVVGTFTVRNAHGLHARPAARLVQEVRALDATVLLRNLSTGSGAVPAASLSKVATLGALRGHQVEVSVTGGQAREALDRVLALARRGFGEPTDSPTTGRGDHGPTGGSRPPDPAYTDPRTGRARDARRPTTQVSAGLAPGTGRVPDPGRPRTGQASDAGRPAGGRGVGFTGLAASPGIGIGPVWRRRRQPIEVPDTRAGDPDTEWRRLRAAVAAVRREVQQVRARTAWRSGEADAEIFDAHLLLLDDAELLAEVRDRVAAGQAAAPAWAATVGRVAAELARLPDPYLRARAADVHAVGDQVLRPLLGGAIPVAAGHGVGQGVLVAPDLTPAEAAGLAPGPVAAVVLAFGSPTAHGAVLARGKDIPMVVGAGPAVLDIADGTVLAVDGGSGEVVAGPDGPALARFRDRAAAQARARAAALAGAAGPAVTRDGVRVPVGANLGSVADARAAAAAGADLAGLVRTEFLFLGRAEPPDVDEQVHAYLALAEALGGRRLTLRTLDVGGDKPLDYLPVPAEANPFLGLRGLRLSLARPALLADQLLAAVRVADATPVSLLFPMVSTVAELLAARRVLDAAVAAEGRGVPAGLQVGIMVEVPAAALKAAALARHADFLSVGTNDLTQYALAAERGNGAVAAVGDPFDPAVLQLIDAACRGAGDVPVAVCGELAADPRATSLLLGLGVRELSVAPAAVPGSKQAVRGVDTRAAAALAAAALRAAGPDAVRTLLAGTPGLPAPDGG